ncbi:MAG: hypothetical protein IIY16_03950, partial [Oscillospiraceae bacterium]|nr:hypothetical protein [Oscillospiraceae bacterium]
SGAETAPATDSETAESTIEDTAVVASIGERSVTWAQYRMTFETYLQYYAEMGFDVFGTEERLSGFQERTVEALLETCVIAHQAELAGCTTLTEEEQAELDEKIAYELAALDDVYLDQVAAEKAADPSLDEEARIQELIAAESYYYTGMQMDYESYLEWISNYYREQFYMEKLRAQTVADVTVSDEQVRSYYDQTLEADQNAILDDPGSYGTAAENAVDIPPLYAPNSYRCVLMLTFAAEDISSDEAYVQITEQLDTLAAEYGDIAIDAELNGVDRSAELAEILERYRILLAEQQKLITAANADAFTEAESVLETVQAEGGFATYENVRTRYISPEYSTAWSKEIIAAVESLEVGEFSEVIQDASGCHILYYNNEVPVGDVAFEEVEALIRNKLLTEAQENVWQAQVDLYMADEEIVRNDKLIHAMRGE